MTTTPNSKIRSMDIPIIDRVFGMEGGVVLNFTNRTFANFFHEEFGVDIYEDRWAARGNSKANRLRHYLQQANCQTALRTLEVLWEYREASSVTADYPILEDKVRTAYFGIIQRLGGGQPKPEVPAVAQQEQFVDAAATSALATRLLEVSKMDSQARGYAFETFLKDVFDAYGMSARAPFRLRGEQIDGSFELNNQTYLLEARWRNTQVDVTTLHAFNGKINEKADWSRGLIISQSGFTEDGLHAFGRGKRIICMDGLDLHEVLYRRLHLADVIAQKVRFAAETGKVYVPVRDLNIRNRK